MWNYVVEHQNQAGTEINCLGSVVTGDEKCDTEIQSYLPETKSINT